MKSNYTRWYNFVADLTSLHVQISFGTRSCTHTQSKPLVFIVIGTHAYINTHFIEYSSFYSYFEYLPNKFQWSLNQNTNILIQEMHLKVPSADWRPFHPGLNVLICYTDVFVTYTHDCKFRHVFGFVIPIVPVYWFRAWVHVNDTNRRKPVTGLSNSWWWVFLLIVVVVCLVCISIPVLISNDHWCLMVWLWMFKENG